MNYIIITDYLLLIPYLAFFYLIAKQMAKNEAPDLRKFLINAFWLRMLGSILFSMVVQYYYGYGDSFTFFKGSNFFTSKISENFSNIRYLFAPVEDVASWYDASSESDKLFSGYFSNPSGNMVMKITTILSYLTFNRFLIISLFFGFFSFYGQWKLFLVFNEINQFKYTKLLAYATLYTPSLWFWGSGLLKDAICMGGLCLIINILYNFFEKKKIAPLNILLLIFLFYLVSVIKSYITIILMLSLGIMFIYSLVGKIKNVITKIILGISIVFIAILVLSQIDFTAQIQDLVEDTVQQINHFQQNYQSVMEDMEDSKGGFSIKEVDPTLSGILLRLPEVIFTCLYRPFIWESKKIMMLFTSLESMLLLYCTLYLLFKTRIKGFIGAIFSNKYLFFCFVMCMLFAAIIGFTTFNFGTMVRYKIILLPFFYFLLVRIHTLTMIRKSLDTKK